MHRHALFLPLFALACGTPATDGDDTDVDETDTVGDTDVVDDTEVDDTVVEDTEVEDTVVVDTEVVDTVVEDTEVVDTVVADSDTAPVVPDVLPSYVIPNSASFADEGAFLEIGSYGRIVLFAKTDDMPDVPFVITGMSFRRDAGGSDFATAASYANTELWLGSANSEWPSSNFADNYTGDETMVWSGTLDVPAIGTYNGAFDDIQVTFTTPFTFDPTTGRKLLIELRGAKGTMVRLDCKNDATIYVAASSAAASPLPTSGPIASGCGYAFRMTTEAVANP